MSVTAHDVAHAYIPELKAPAKLTLCLVVGAERVGLVVDVADIAILAGMSRRSAQDNVNKLIQLGYIARTDAGLLVGANVPTLSA